MSAPLIRARGLVKTYDEPRRPMRRFWSAVRGRPVAEPWHTVLDGIDLDIWPGETLGILGRNGAGKSTLLAILAGARSATAGTVERRGRIVPILELGGGLDNDRTGRVNVVQMAGSFGIRRDELPQIIEDAEEFADVGSFFDKPLRMHSSGMRSRVAFGAALALRGDLVMLDETLAVGDLSFRLRCYELIQKRQREGTSFLLVGHNPNTLANLCMRIIVLDQSRIVYDGPPAGAVSLYKSLRLNAHNGGRPLDLATLGVIGDTEVRGKLGATISLPLRVVSKRPLNAPSINVGILQADGLGLCSTHFNIPENAENTSEITLKLTFCNRLRAGEYRLVGYVSENVAGEDYPVGYSSNLARIISEADDDVHGLADFAIAAGVA